MSSPELPRISLPVEERFSAIDTQLEVLKGFAGKTHLNRDELNTLFTTTVKALGHASIYASQGKVGGSLSGAKQDIRDDKGKIYKFDLTSAKLSTEIDEGFVINPDAVNELEQLVNVARGVAARIVNLPHVQQLVSAGAKKVAKNLDTFVREDFPKGAQRFGKDVATGATFVGAGIVATIAVPVGLIVGAGKWIEEQLQPLSKSLGEAFQPILEALERAVNATGEKLKQAAKTIRNGLQTMADQINTHLVEPHLLPLYNATLGPVLALLNKVSGDVYKWGAKNVYPKLAQAATDLAEVAAGIATITTRAATWLFVTAPVGVYKNAKAGLEAAGAEISRIAHNTYTSAAAKLTSAGKTIRETFEKLPGEAQEAARLAYNDTVAALTKARDAIKEFGTGTDAAWQTNVQPHLNRAGQAIVDLDSALGGYGAAASQRIGDAIQATGQALYELGSVAYSRAFGAKLTASEQNAMLTTAGELVGVVNTSIQVAIKSAEDLGLSAIEDPYIKQMLSQGWLGGIGAGPRQLLINLQNRVKDGKITPQEFQSKLAVIMKSMPVPMALALNAPKSVPAALSDPHLFGKTMAIMPEAAAVLAIAPSSGRREPAAIGSTATSAPPSPRRGEGVGSPSVADKEVAAAFTLFESRSPRTPEELADDDAARLADLSTGAGGLDLTASMRSFRENAPPSGRGSPPPPPFPRSRGDSDSVGGSFSDDGSDGGSSAGSTSPR